MTPRGLEVYALLRSFWAWLPSPGRRPTEQGQAGFTDGRRDMSCPDCLANDALQRGMHGCETCGGSGRVPETGRDPYDTGKATSVGGHQGDRDRDAQRRTDELLRRLAADAAIRAGDASAVVLDPLTAAVDRAERWYRAGSYRELGRVLRSLERTAPHWHRLAVTIAAEGDETPVRPASRRVEVLCELIAPLMPDPIRVPRGVPVAEHTAAEKEALWRGRGDWHQKTRRQRAEWIADLRAEGKTAGTIARELGLSKRRVEQILADQAASVAVATAPAA